MDTTLCGLGLPELIVIMLVGFVVIGPQRSREIAVVAGRLIRRAMRSEWWREFNQVTSALRDLPNTLVRMAELEDDLMRVRSDLSQVARLDVINTMEGAGGKRPAVEADVDPWGIGSNAASPPDDSSADAEPPEEQSNP